MPLTFSTICHQDTLSNCKNKDKGLYAFKLNTQLHTNLKNTWEKHKKDNSTTAEWKTSIESTLKSDKFSTAFTLLSSNNLASATLINRPLKEAEISGTVILKGQLFPLTILCIIKDSYNKPKLLRKNKYTTPTTELLTNTKTRAITMHMEGTPGRCEQAEAAITSIRKEVPIKISSQNIIMKLFPSQLLERRRMKLDLQVASLK